MRTSAPALLPIFRSELQARMLAELLREPVRFESASELRAATGGSQASVHRELQRLLAAGIVEAEHVGRTIRYRVAEDSPLAAPLRMLIERTLGAETLLRESLASVDGVEAAAIYGSWARGDVTPTSDVDVLVVGDATPGDVYEAVREPERISGRSIDVRVYGREELRRRRGEGSTFLDEVLQGELTPLVGDVRELAR